MQSEIDNPTKIINAHNEVLVFRSCSAVALIVSDRVAKAAAGRPFHGAFLTPAEAREIAQNLISAADRAETTVNMTKAQYEEWRHEHFPPALAR